MKQIAYFGTNFSSINQYLNNQIIDNEKNITFIDLSEKITALYLQDNESFLSIESYAKSKFNMEKDTTVGLFGTWINTQGHFDNYTLSNYMSSILSLKNVDKYRPFYINPYAYGTTPTIIIPSTIDVEKTNQNITQQCQHYFSTIQKTFNLSLSDQEKKQYILDKIDSFYQYMILYDLTIEEKRDIRTLNDLGLLYIISVN